MTPRTSSEKPRYALLQLHSMVIFQTVAMIFTPGTGSRQSLCIIGLVTEYDVYMFIKNRQDRNLKMSSDKIVI